MPIGIGFWAKFAAWINGVTTLPDTLTPTVTPSFLYTPQGTAPADAQTDSLTPTLTPSFLYTPQGTTPAGSQQDTLTPTVTPSFSYTPPTGTFVDTFQGSTLGGTWVWLNQVSSTAVVNNGLTLTKAGTSGWSCLLQPEICDGVTTTLNFYSKVGALSGGQKGLVMYNSANGRLVFAMYTGGLYCAEWTNVTTGSSNPYGPISVTPDTFFRINVGLGHTTIFTSSDAKTWTTRVTDTSAVWTWLGATTHVGLAVYDGSAITTGVFVIT